VLLYRIKSVSDSERLLREGLTERLVDGLIVSPLSFSGGEIGRKAAAPMVLLGAHAIDEGIDSVSIDETAAVQAATEHLTTLGRRRIAILLGQSITSGAAARLRGYRRALEVGGIAFDRRLVHFSEDDSRMTGCVAMDALMRLTPSPDGVICCSDLLAAGALRALLTGGWQVPEDVALVSFDGTEAGAYLTPALSTISPDKEEIARLAITTLKRRISDVEGVCEPTRTHAGFRLIVRQSTDRNASVKIGPEDQGATGR
jgi:DNA-binding LacI/PurR family transcriptional regulator